MYRKTNKNYHTKNPQPTSHIYMERFCRALHSDLDLSPTCVSWFRQATEHCTELILQKRRGPAFWTTVKNFIFPSRQTSLLNQKIPISIHPNRLSVSDCHALFFDIVNDYVERAPRYSIEAATNALLWQILYSLMGIMALGTLLVTTIFAYRKFGKTLQKSLDPLAAVFEPEKRAAAYVNRNLRVVKYELQRLHVRHIIQPEEVLAPDGTATLVLKVASKLSFLDGIVGSNTHCSGRLFRLQELNTTTKHEYKTEAIAKMMRFINNYSRKLRLMVIFDEDPIYEELLRRRRSHPVKAATPLTLKNVGGRKSSGSYSARSIISRSSSPPISKLPGSPRLPTQIPRNLTRRASNIAMKK
ncbi:uncharacterized protein LOC105664537 [Ceratitis capitata]|uniref:uncharacterized protein LOC105664537 n=1 Tax=Ceratitis capitata TaxID=7213 RepID=UPI000A0FECE1|nr:uncharacterized protein LOC105664537 [Ceratitis capitata]